MARIFTRLLAALTLGPILLWLLAVVITFVLKNLAGCRIDDAGPQSCLVLGMDLGKTAASVGAYASAGFWAFWPLIVSAGMMWALVVGARMILSDKG